MCLKKNKNTHESMDVDFSRVTGTSLSLTIVMYTILTDFDVNIFRGFVRKLSKNIG